MKHKLEKDSVKTSDADILKRSWVGFHFFGKQLFLDEEEEEAVSHTQIKD